MSRLGHSRRSDGQQGFAECPLCLQWRPNLCVATNRRDVPMRQMQPQQTRLFDHLVGAGEQRWRHVEAERLGGLEVDDQLVLGRRLHRQVGGLLALEDAIDIAGRAPVLVEQDRARRRSGRRR